MADAVAGADLTRERIEEVALDLLLERGYEGTPLRVIAEAMNVTVPALYWHFSSKSDLCASAVAREFEHFRDVVTAAIDPAAAPDEQLRAYVIAFVGYQLQGRRRAMGLGFDHLAASLPENDRVRIAALQRTLHHQLRAILEEGRRAGVFAFRDPTVSTFAVTTMCNHVFTWYKPGGRLGVDAVARGYAEIALGLVGGRISRATR
jgi:AcrR family transcriptional regulator